MSQDIVSINTSKWRQWNIFTSMKILFEYISYFFEYEHFKLDIFFCRTPCSTCSSNKHNKHKFLAKICSGIIKVLEYINFVDFPL